MDSDLPYFAPAAFDDPAAALERVRLVYGSSVGWLRQVLGRFVAGDDVGPHVRACYPFVRVHTDTGARADSRLSYGFVAGRGSYETTLTRPDLFGNYYLEQFRLLIENRAFLVTANYEALLAYNCAHTYALSVAMLADRIPAF